MLLTVGDLVEDIVVAAPQAMNDEAGSLPAGSRIGLELGADVEVTVARRRGGSAANVAEAAARAGSASRFVGQVGDDRLGFTLVDELAAAGVDAVVHHDGRTGTIVVLCHETAGGRSERTMLTDRGAALDLAPAEAAWLDGATHLHLPLYSLVDGALAATCQTLAGMATARSTSVSIDLSATSAIGGLGIASCHRLLDELQPAVVFANEAEAGMLRQDRTPSWLTGSVFVEKRGPAPARIASNGAEAVEIPAVDLGPIDDTTGAGDAFAAGFLAAFAEGASPTEATARGHRIAADHLRRVSST